MSKVSNILTMLDFLSTGKKYSIKELSDALEVSPRMIRFYKDELEKAGIYLHTIKGPYGGYTLNQELNIPKRFVPSKEIVLKDKKVFNILNKAIKEKRKCYLEYFSKEKNISTRIVHPYEMTLLNNEWGVAGFCEKKEEIRHFYLNRIKSIKLLDEIY